MDVDIGPFAFDSGTEFFRLPARYLRNEVKAYMPVLVFSRDMECNLIPQTLYVPSSFDICICQSFCRIGTI